MCLGYGVGYLVLFEKGHRCWAIYSLFAVFKTIHWHLENNPKPGDNFALDVWLKCIGYTFFGFSVK